MANEIAVNGCLQYSDSEGSEAFLEQVDDAADVATKKFARLKQAVGTSEEALQLGDVTAPGWVMLKNLDATNYVEVKTGVGGTVVGKMLAGESYGPVRLGTGMQAPYLIANTAACQVEVLVIQT